MWTLLVCDQIKLLPLSEDEIPRVHQNPTKLEAYMLLAWFISVLK